jgi:mannose-6-phosphate isomerase-like protein (cupin superfamily)
MKSDIQRVNLAGKFNLFTEHWSPKILAELNGQQVRIVKVKGEFVWHHHDDADELFLVVKGTLAIHFKDNVVRLEEGEFCVVPRGVEHKPVASEEAHVLLFEPAATVNTGNNREAAQTVLRPDWI